MTVHRTAATGYDRVADAYELGRPGYPSIAVSWLGDRLGLTTGATLVDLGPGSGQLTRLLAQTAARVVAVEPVEAMREKLRDIPGVEVMTGAGADIALPDASIAAITVANAFHWFATEDALLEMTRVLEPGGRIGLVWNRRDKSQSLQQALTALVEPYRVDEPSYASMDWRQVVDSSPLFSIVEEATFENLHATTVDGVVARVLSTSFIAALPTSEQEKVLAQARELAFAEPQPITLRYFTDAYLLVSTGHA